MDFTIEVSKAFNLSPFNVLQQDTQEVIMLINYYITKGEEIDTSDINKNTTTAAGKNARVRVNDKTATGGWF